MSLKFLENSRIFYLSDCKSRETINIRTIVMRILIFSKAVEKDG